MNKFANTIYNHKLRRIYIYVLLFFMCIKFPNPFQGLTDYPLLIMALIGGFYLVCDLFMERKFLNTKYVYLLIASCLVFFISFIVNFDDNWLKNLRSLSLTIIFYFILFNSNHGSDDTEVKKELFNVNRIIILVTFVLSVFSVIFVFLNMTIIFNSVLGQSHIIGWETGKNFGIYGNPNQMGMVATLSAIISIIELSAKINLSQKWKIITIANLAVQIIALLSGGSRGFFIQLVVFVSIFVLCVCFIKYSINIKSIIIGVSSTVIILLLLLLSSIATQDLAVINIGTYVIDASKPLEGIKVRYVNNSIEQSISTFKTNTVERLVEGSIAPQNTLQDKPGDTSKEIQKNTQDYGSGRIKLWKSGVEVFIKHPVIGAGLYGLEDSIRDESTYFEGCTKEFIESNYMHWFSMHNDFLQPFVSNGTLGGIIYILFIILMVSFTFKKTILHIKYAQNDSILFIGLLAFCISTLVSSLVAYVIFFNSGGSAAIFWLYLGYAVFFARNTKDKNIIGNGDQGNVATEVNVIE